MKNIMIIGANGFTGRQILNDLSSKAQYEGKQDVPCIRISFRRMEATIISSPQIYGMKQP